MFFTPAVVPWTLMETTQVADGAKAPAAKLTEPEPAVPVEVPPQELVKLGVGATTRPVGRVSVNAMPVRATAAFGF